MEFDGTIRRTLFWLNDKWCNHSLVKKQYEEIMYALEENYDQSEEWLCQRDSLVAHAIKTSKFYSAYKGKKFEDFPVINKKICLEQYDDFLSYNYKTKKLHKISTNGSSGTPFTILQNVEKRSRVIAELKAFMAICGLLPNQKMIYLDAMSARNKKKTGYEQWKENIWRIDISNMGRENVKEVIAFLKRHSSKLILAYPSTLECIANYAANSKILKELPVETIIAAGETLHSETRRKAKSIFSEQTKIYSRYSNQEMGILGQEREENGSYLLNHASYYFECLKLDEDKPTEEGEIGRIVITDLYNYAFPLIRYDTEDTGIMERKQGVSNYPVLRRVYGKRKDILYDYKKEPVIPDVVDEMFFGKSNIRQWRLIQEEYTKIRLIVCCNENGKRDIEEICKKIRKHFGKDVHILVDYVDKIKNEKGGKYHYIVCKIPEIVKKH
jgi:hypothetical protein